MIPACPTPDPQHTDFFCCIKKYTDTYYRFCVGYGRQLFIVRRLLSAIMSVTVTYSNNDNILTFQVVFCKILILFWNNYRNKYRNILISI